MSIKDFILSNKRSNRIKRHLLFWAFWSFYFTMVRLLNPMAVIQTGRLTAVGTTIIEAVLMLLPQTILVYSLIYFVLPRFVFKSKYVKAVAWFILFLFITFTVNALFILYVPYFSPIYYPNIRKLFGGIGNYRTKIFLAYLASLQGALTGAALAASFKMFKHYYLKEIRNQQLQKENATSQLQILTAQIHPHFLFNTLNNIYSKAQSESPGSAKMIIELSHILRFVMNEGKNPLIPLENELHMIRDYINLEKTRYDDKLDLHLQFPSDTEDVYIAPLLLLPFVENCFKHGSSQILRNPWINLKMELSEVNFSMKIMNGKKKNPPKLSNRKGTGIVNVQKRLELLYNDKYSMVINEDEEVYIVNLKIELEKKKPSQMEQPKAVNPSYA